MREITAYTPTWSLEPGDEVPVKVNSEAEYEADIVRLICGDTHPDGPGYKDELVDADVAERATARVQEIHAGSYLEVPDHPALTPEDGLTLMAYAWPTMPAAGEQGLLTKWADGTGYGLFVGADGALEFRLGDGDETVSVSTDDPLEAEAWYFVGAALDPATGSVAVWQEPVGGVGSPAAGAGSVDAELASNDAPFLVGASATRTDDGVVGERCYNGKLDRPRVTGEALTADDAASVIDDPQSHEGTLVAAWAFDAEIGPDGVHPHGSVTDEGPHDLTATAVNLPARAVTGHNWTGEEQVFSHAPEQYAAIHFHEDDLEDAGWETDFTWSIPQALDSGIYAAHLRTANDETYVPFFVRPGPAADRADIAFLVPTTTYTAYADEHGATDHASLEAVTGQVPILQRKDVFLSNHREYGLAIYDTHADESAVYYSSRRRPILTMSPKHKYFYAPLPSMNWGLSADLHIIDWLEANGYDYDVITDDDLHNEGPGIIEPYNVVLTGNHPEYYTEAMFDALERYKRDGGRLMYLGGNGFYWITAYPPTDNEVVEVRKGSSGTARAGDMPAGEHYMSFDGSKGGLWRTQDRAPQRLAGVGMTAQGMDQSSYYRRQPDSYEPECAFIFDGVEAEVVGDHGMLGGGAAGLELDRYDEALGTPRDTRLLATSEGHSDSMTITPEDIFLTPPGQLSGTDTPEVRADLVYRKNDHGGGFFSVGSMAWAGSLGTAEYDNDVAQITANVLDAFAADGPLPE